MGALLWQLNVFCLVPIQILFISFQYCIEKLNVAKKNMKIQT